MQPSQACFDLVAKFEGFRAHAYLCPAGVWTIGYGFTKGVKKGDAITKGQADARLAHELDDFADGVKKLVKVPLKQCQFDALVSFVFNVGVGALRDSTLLKLLNAGNYAGAADQFTRWNKAGGKVLPGLVTRRAAEKEMFLSC